MVIYPLEKKDVYMDLKLKDKLVLITVRLAANTFYKQKLPSGSFNFLKESYGNLHK